jgi:hypothetical protein
MSITGEKFSLLEEGGKDGILALMIAYGKNATGRDDFDLMTLVG